MPTTLELAGRTALVSGGAGGAIGSAICRLLASLGASIVILDSHAARTALVAESLREEFGTRVIEAPFDVTSREAVDELVSTVGPIDILVNNAAINRQGSIFDFDPEEFDRIIAVDLTACWYLMRAVVPGMRDRHEGSVVNIGSVAAYIGGNGREGPYSAAKAALNELTRSAAIECGPYDIRVNCVAPGLVDSKWVDAQANYYESFRLATPLGRHASPEDVANVVAFLVSDKSAHITGEVINVSGGWCLTR